MNGARIAAGAGVLSGRPVATYATYRDAERAVERLTRAGFPVERVTIVGRGLKYVEQVIGRLGWGAVALRGGLSGAVAGALIGWLFGLFDWFHPITAAGWLALEGFGFGAVFGALTGLLLYAFMRDRRDFLSLGAMTADHFDVVVEESVADRAVGLLSDGEPSDDATAAPAPPPAGTARPQR